MITWFLSERMSGQRRFERGSTRQKQSPCSLPALGRWQWMLCGRSHDALVLSRASAGVYHLIEEWSPSCNHEVTSLPCFCLSNLLEEE